MNFNNEVNESYMNILCDNLAKFQMALMSDKTDDPEKIKKTSLSS